MLNVLKKKSMFWNFNFTYKKVLDLLVNVPKSLSTRIIAFENQLTINMMYFHLKT